MNSNNISNPNEDLQNESLLSLSTAIDDSMKCETLANDIANLPSTPIPDTQVFFDTTLPTDPGVIFTPDTPELENTLYTSCHGFSDHCKFM